MARRTFFSFHYAADIWRAMNVRNSWVVKKDEQIDRGFFDASVFEATKKKGDELIKAFLRDGLDNSSVTCVLTGTETWKRRWVRYEIVRSVVRRNGLLTVFVHGLKDKDGQIAAKGYDPLWQVGVYKTAAGIFFAEWKDGKWAKYDDYTLSISAGELWFAAPKDDSVVALGSHCMSYDFTAQNGRKDIGGWIETTAGLAGR